VKGGAAVTKDKYEIYDIPSGLVAATGSETRWGGVVGVGAEYGFTPNWSIALEYDHMFMGHRDVSFFQTANLSGTAGAPALTSRISQDVDVVTARVNYRFGGPVVGRY
jgi:outer membrane immunogenic protein